MISVSVNKKGTKCRSRNICAAGLERAYFYELVMLSFGDCSGVLYWGLNQDMTCGDSVGKTPIYKKNKNSLISLLTEVSGTNFYTCLWEKKGKEVAKWMG